MAAEVQGDTEPKVATPCSPGPWTVESIAEGRSPSIAIDALGKVHVAFSSQAASGFGATDRFERGHGDLIHATRQDSGWRTSTVDSAEDDAQGILAGVCGYHTSIQVDVTGNVHISYCMLRFDGNSLVPPYWHAQITEEGITRRPLPFTEEALLPYAYAFRYGPSGYLQSATIVIDPTGILHAMVPGGAVINSLRQGRFSAIDGWSFDTLVPESETMPLVAFSPETLVVSDEQGGLHTAFGNSDGSFYYAHRAVGGSWSTEILQSFDGDTAGLLDVPAIAVDRSGGVHVTFGKAGYLGTRYAYRPTSDGAWRIADAPFSGALAVDLEGRPHLTNGRDYAILEDGAWSTSVIDSGLHAGSLTISRNALLIDSSGREHLVFASLAFGNKASLVSYATRQGCQQGHSPASIN